MNSAPTTLPQATGRLLSPETLPDQRELVLRVLKVVGVRLTTQQAAKYVPIAGQAVSAALTYTALKFVIHQHIRQCRDIAGQLRLPPPEAV